MQSQIPKYEYGTVFISGSDMADLHDTFDKLLDEAAAEGWQIAGPMMVVPIDQYNAGLSQQMKRYHSQFLNRAEDALVVE